MLKYEKNMQHITNNTQQNQNREEYIKHAISSECKEGRIFLVPGGPGPTPLPPRVGEVVQNPLPSYTTNAHCFGQSGGGGSALTAKAEKKTGPLAGATPCLRSSEYTSRMAVLLGSSVKRPRRQFLCTVFSSGWGGGEREASHLGTLRRRPQLRQMG